jgi:hypothetical protein
MTGSGAGHAALEEMAAGYALNALEPADEQRFLRHADDCPRCQELVAGFREVAEALAEAAPPAEPGGRLGDRILAVARPLAGAAEPGRRARVAELEPAGRGGAAAPRTRGRRRRRVAAVAAAAAILAGGGVWGGLAATAPGPRPGLAACARPGACLQVALTAAGTGRTAATVIVHDGLVWMQPGAMTANPAGEIYVLWQITGAHIPLPVGSFDVHAGARTPVRIGDVAVPYRGTWAFAVSLEHGRTIPARPSRPVALGQVS